MANRQAILEERAPLVVKSLVRGLTQAEGERLAELNGLLDQLDEEEFGLGPLAEAVEKAQALARDVSDLVEEARSWESDDVD